MAKQITEYKISYNDKLNEVSREIEYRRKVYSRLVNEGKIPAHLANHRMAVMLEIEKDYKGIVLKGQDNLFG